MKMNWKKIMSAVLCVASITAMAPMAVSAAEPETSTTYISGDVNMDGEVSVSDMVMLQKWVLGQSDLEQLPCWQASDLCEDDTVDVYDLALLKMMLTNQGEVCSALYYAATQKNYVDGAELKCELINNGDGTRISFCINDEIGGAEKDYFIFDTTGLLHSDYNGLSFQYQLENPEAITMVQNTVVKVKEYIAAHMGAGDTYKMTEEDVKFMKETIANMGITKNFLVQQEMLKYEYLNLAPQV